MKTHRVVLLICLAIILFTGYAASASFKPIKDQSTRRQYQGYSILPPQGPNWFLMQEGQGGVAFTKKTGSATHTFTVAVLIARIPPSWKTQNEFLDYVKNGKRAGTDPRRFKIIEEDYSLDNKFGQYSVKYHIKVEDHGAVKTDGAPFLILDVSGYCCMHPKLRNSYYDIQYSERSKPGESDLSLKIIGEEFVNNFRFK
ncbi:MAG: hypothetical protein JSV93_04035 [Candidatus Omnitrophota bacterium]|nr:MAG: hypothetical protein JSV93_04035 [Candidatus Omnitrophota bacterium]